MSRDGVRWQSLRRGDVAAARAGAAPSRSYPSGRSSSTATTCRWTPTATPRRPSRSVPPRLRPSLSWSRPPCGGASRATGWASRGPSRCRRGPWRRCSSRSARASPRTASAHRAAERPRRQHRARCTRRAPVSPRTGIRAAGRPLLAARRDRAGGALPASMRGSIGHAGRDRDLAPAPPATGGGGSAPVRRRATRMPRSVLPPPLASVAVMPPDPASESPTGVYGGFLPSRALDLGARAMGAIVARLVELLAAFRETPVPVGWGRHAR